MPTAAIALGTGAATTGAHPYCLFLDGLDVIKQPGAGGSILGVDVDTIDVHDTLGQPPMLTFAIDDPLNVLAIAKNANVYLCDHRGRQSSGNAFTTDDLFRGQVSSLKKVPISGTSWRWEVVAIGLESLLDQRVVVSGLSPSGLDTVAAMQSVLQNMDGRISALSGDLGALSVARSGLSDLISGSGGGGVNANAVPLAGKTFRQALQDISAASTLTRSFGDAGEQRDVVDVDPQGRIRWWPAQGFNNSLPFGTIYEGVTASTTAPYVTRAAPSDISVTQDNSALVNAVYVQGVDALSSGWVTDDASIGLYGRFEAYLSAPECTSSAAVQSIGQSFLAAHRIITRIEFSLEDSHDSLIAAATSDTNYVAWHTRARSDLRSDSGYWPTNAASYVLHDIERRFSGGGNALSLRLGFYGGPQRGPNAIRAAIAAVQQDSRSAQRLVGTLGEVAVRTKAGVPTDADFDIPRDGFLVVDTVNKTIWTRVNGLWQPGSGYVYDYAEAIATVAPAPGPTTLVTGNPVVWDGATTVELVFFCEDVRPDSANANPNVQIILQEDGANVAVIGSLITLGTGSDRKPVYVGRHFTPTAGSHTYRIQGLASVGAANFVAGIGTGGAAAPMYLLIRKA